MDVATIAAAGLTAVTLYLLGIMCHHLVGLPAPVAMLFLAVLAKLTQRRLAAPAGGRLRRLQVRPTGDDLSAAVRHRRVADALGQAGGRVHPAEPHHHRRDGVDADGTGAVVGRWLKMYPIETAIVNACHSGQGGTGDVAILTAANRMQLMPFAQIATRIGGAITVTAVLMVLRWVA